MAWDETSIPNLTGKVILVTGGNSGIGFETVKQLVLHGAKVYIGARSESRAKQAISDILSENPSIPKELLEWLPLDLSSLPNVIKAANLFSTTETRLDILINNAGISSDEYVTTKEGFEQSLGATADVPGSDVRIVNVSSLAEKFASSSNNFTTVKDFSDPGATNPNDYTSRKAVFKRYGISKLANILFTKELQNQLTQQNSRIIAITLDPGPVATDGGMGVFPGLLKPVLKLVMKSPAKGALTQLFCATAPEVAREAARYRGQFLNGPGKIAQSSERSRNKELAQSLWKISEEVLKGVDQ
ncbi:hypothetical protein TRIATDRAFT_191627 [Trichoderma atroviride IMI 206040]|uniref:Uncharacterized protein n=1 Tax=Hypocrea atroviridis (strain ATCC 20476 / IMI 206040) TaxID=452589 RepID=G9NLJ1_HYPAI|nr:uncharacterized protein TRIATDRAFT_191627 [Trichoderma atroviride IMI 206040]EHK48753.1 hypothetical protein TRIATDRAFT_191627 [Trichoderma atroviride IMI 206040]